MNGIGIKIKEAREKAGLSLRDLAAITGVNFSTLNRIELGKARAKHDDMLKIYNALNMTLNLELQVENYDEQVLIEAWRVGDYRHPFVIRPKSGHARKSHQFGRSVKVQRIARLDGQDFYGRIFSQV